VSAAQAPLEAMGKRVRSGQRVDISLLKSLSRRKKFVFVIAAVAFSSLGLGVFINAGNSANLERLVLTVSSFEPGSTSLAYRQGYDQVSRILATMQLGTGLLRLLATPADPARRAFARLRLKKLEETLWQDFAIFLDSEGKVLVSANTGSMDGKPFEVSGIVRATLDTGMRYVRT
jgi:hypothetical protein